jgi:hypothetical protein
VSPKKKGKKRSPKSKMMEVSIEEHDGREWLCVPCLDDPKSRYKLALEPIRILIANYDRQKDEAWRKSMVV